MNLDGLKRGVRSIAPGRESLRGEALAGLPGAISSVPDGMASGVLAGVSPVAGLYASAFGPITGGLTSSTRRMVITTTSAAALAAGAAIAHVDAADKTDAMILLTLMAGLLMAAAGFAKLGRYTRFVSHSVMLGFLTGIAVNIICGQLGDLTGVAARGSTNVAKALYVIAHPGDISWASLATGVAALLLLVVLARTRVAVVSTLIALVLPTAVVLLTDAAVALVEDGGKIPSGLPLPTWPHFDLLNGSLIGGALAVAAIVLVQGAGVAESAPNPEGRSNPNQDFVAQGVGNVAAGVFRGMPVGGSVGQTALNVAAGGKGRWSTILSGVWMLVILLAFAPAVGKVAMPTLAAVLIFAAWGSFRPGEIMTILHAGPNSQIAIIGTFAATLVFPVPAAVGLGVVVSLLLQLNQEAIDLEVVELVTLPDGRQAEAPVPTQLPSGQVTVLDVYGSLFYAGSRTLQSRLPDPAGSTRPVVVLRLRGRTTLGATFFTVAGAYARKLAEVGGRLYLSGLDPELAHRMAASGNDPLRSSVRLYEETSIIGESTHSAVADASAWLVAAGDEPPD